MSLNCLKGCVRDYDVSGVRKPVTGAVIMPWVEVWFDGSNRRIGVSNVSSRLNQAAIKSFQFGISNGTGVVIEIIDESSSNFSKFLNRISTGNQESANRNVLKFQFGWTSADCNSPFTSNNRSNCCTEVSNERPTRSCVHTMFITKVTGNMQGGGLCRYVVEGNDFTRDAFTTRPRVTFGTDREPVRLREAIRKLCVGQLGLEIQLLKLNSSCREEEFTFREQGQIDRINGPLGRWETMGRSVISACMNWLSDYVSDSNKGFYTCFRTDKNVIAFVESNRMECDYNRDINNYNLGTYIVGGDCSPVISFTPSINFNVAAMNSLFDNTDNAPGGVLSPREFVRPEGCNQTPNADNQGLNITSLESDNNYRVFGTSATQIGGRNRSINRRENMLLTGPIEAELRIQGDPSYSSPIMCVGSYVSVVCLTPFVIANTGRQCDWLNDGCNLTLSNRRWMITGMSHDIREGSFVTTLRLNLAAPGVDISRNAGGAFGSFYNFWGLG